MEDNKLVCPWLPSTMVSDDGGRVTAFADCYGERCPYWGIVRVAGRVYGSPRPVWGCRRVDEVLCDD